jgi:hypothetical protein
MKSAFWWSAIIVLWVGIAAFFYYWKHNEAREPQLQPPPRAEAPPAPETKVEPQIRHPIEGIASEGQETSLPALAESDKAAQEALGGLYGQKATEQFFYPTDIIRRIVATVDNLPRQKAALRLMPVKPVPGQFVTAGEEASRSIGADNYRRYAPYVLVAEAVDAKKLVTAYVRFYPLFQQAYKELGYPTGYFNDRLVETIDNLLAAPDVQGPVKLVRPKVMYQFADPQLEQLSAGQKIMVRIGAENAARIKTRLRDIRRELTGETSRP